MKVAFSTLGCPEWSWEDMLATAKDFGYDGIEVRGIENELHVPKAKPFSVNNISSVKLRLEKLGLEIPCLTSSSYLSDSDSSGENLKEGMEYIDLAEKLGTPYIRVLGDNTPEPQKNVDMDVTVKNLVVLADYAKNKGVQILVETNGAYAESAKMLSLMKTVQSGSIGVLWDIHHPFRFFNEDAEKTYNTLKEYIRFVHIKDSIVENSGIKYKMTGFGDVPVEKALRLLKSHNYKGYISLEWVKRWCIELEDPGVVFSHFVNYVKDFTAIR